MIEAKDIQDRGRQALFGLDAADDLRKPTSPDLGAAALEISRDSSIANCPGLVSPFVHVLTAY